MCAEKSYATTVRRVLITGASGAVGSVAQKSLDRLGEIFPFDINELDVTDSKSTQHVFQNIKPTTVLHLAAITDLNLCETNKELATQVNFYGTKNVVDSCVKSGADLIFMSSEAVFNGSKREGYSEQAACRPQNYYGQTKLESEIYIKKNLKKYYITRASWLYGSSVSQKLLEKLLPKLLRDEPVSVVDDKFGNPTLIKDLVETLGNIIEGKHGYGTYHIVNSGSCSRFEFILTAAKCIGRSYLVTPTSSDTFLSNVNRGRYALLKNTKINPLRNWKIALAEYMEEVTN
ncbi:NAD(P)-dependent oxidoreductase [candidate division WWE3 bacterium]|uniref:dTDP-4-dehydrorhamnose reductase n=1 Tax=candidate division WWE3 bacterium TaxID=2053526 RepID=A0A955LJN0_UNCKA|nr:NAD(P)-dependent oxidoreductase [candidate division WWE3 bacterium]